MHPDLERILHTEQEIAQAVKGMADRIAADYSGTAPLAVGVLKGAFIFMSDLARAVPIPLELDFIATSSYGDATQSSGVVRIQKDLDRPVEGRDVLLVEDIVDSGLTLAYLKDLLLRRRARSVKVAAAFDKPGNRRVDIRADYVGFEVPNRFLVGYGLDYAERYRNLPYLGILRPSVYA
jgi:hypoxanthine phosphoribosyltransferase